MKNHSLILTLVYLFVFSSTSWSQTSNSNREANRLERARLKDLGLEYSKNLKGAKTFDVLAGMMAAPEQECSNAIPVCQSSYSQSNSYSGFGNTQEIPVNSSCLGDEEKNSVWYTFTAQTNGLLQFDISPNDPLDDYDFALYNITGKSCTNIKNGTLAPIRCNYSSDYGTTGINTSGTQASVTSTGYIYSSALNVTAGQTFVLVVSNYSSSQSGYTLSFDTNAGSPTIFDNVPPTPASVSAPCGSSLITVTLSEFITCASLATDGTDFTLASAGGINYTISAANGLNCTGYTNQIQLTISPVILITDTLILTAQNGTDGNTLLDNCGNAMVVGDTIKFFYSPATPGSITASKDTVCPGTTVSLTASDGTAWTWNNGETTQNTDSVITATTTFNVQISLGTCGNTSATKTIRIKTISINPTQNTTNAICTASNGAITNLAVTPSASNYTYSWYNGTTLSTGSLIAGQSTKNLTNQPAGTYTVVVTSPEGCADTSSFVITKTNQNLLGGLTDTTSEFCDLNNGSITGVTLLNGATTYSWFLESTPLPVFVTDTTLNPTGLTSGNYFIITTNSNGCVDTLNFTINNYKDAMASFVADSLTGYSPLTVNFSNTSVGNVINSWTFSDTSASFTTANTTHLFSKPGDYNVLLTITDQYGCTDTASIKIIAKDPFSYEVPNIFSPNDDGKNDVFKIPGNGIKEVNYLIYNRWGNKVYGPSTTPWDGKNHDNGVYYYILKITANNGTEVNDLKGTVTLVK